MPRISKVRGTAGPGSLTGYHNSTKPDCPGVGAPAAVVAVTAVVAVGTVDRTVILNGSVLVVLVTAECSSST